MNRTLANPRTFLLLLALAAGLAFVINGQRPGNAERPPPLEVKNVSVDEARALIDAGALVVDVRGKEAFDRRHLPGALLIPLTVLRLGIPPAIADAKDKPVVVYCGDGVTQGPEGTQVLNQAGFTHAVNVKGGIESWAAAGMPIAK